MNLADTLWTQAFQLGEDGGAFRIKSPTDNATLTVIASFGGEWDHVSVSHPRRIPSWIEMSHIKRMFFDPDEVAMQLHPSEDNYVNNHPRCLHLWRPQHDAIPTPPEWMVGIKELGENVSRSTALQVQAAIMGLLT